MWLSKLTKSKLHGTKKACRKICENTDEKDGNPAKGLKMLQIIKQ